MKVREFPAESLSLRRRVEQFSWSEGSTTRPHYRGYSCNVQFDRPTERATPPHSYGDKRGWIRSALSSYTGHGILLILSSLKEKKTETPPKDGEEAASSSDSASDAASSLFNHWGRDLGPESRRVALKKFRYFGYNGYLSDRISLTRPIPDLRPDGCRNMSYSSDLPQLSVIFIFVNEALSVLLRSIHTVIQRTPSYLLKEIILVDDNSNS
ncbi:Polypeptide N-acetylgalactosaminyltransferase 18, partial [Characodon lateralis]|nr:Polypeptide N-acetylgalactosaminyltransferase 18 [Characodon lateralis]